MDASFVNALRRVFAGAGIRVIGIPVTAVLGLLNTGLIIANTGSVVYGVVSAVATLGVLLPFADLGLGAVVTTAVAIAHNDPSKREHALATLHAAMRRLVMVAVIGIGVVALLTLTGAWQVILSRSLTPTESALIGAALVMFLVAVPLGLGGRCLIGLDLNHVAVALSLLVPGWALLCTGSLALFGVQGMAYAMSGYFGVLVGSLVTFLVAMRQMRRAGMPMFATVSEDSRRMTGLLAGSLWMLVIMVGLPIGLETGRLILAHLGTPIELSQYALAAQLYALTWSVLATSGQALWSVFARQRADAEGSLRLWRQMVGLFGAAALIGGTILVLVGPWLAGVIARGVVEVTVGQLLAFALLLLAQALHLPGGVLVTRPEELRWQAICVCAMAVLSIVAAILTAGTYGGVGVTLSAAAAVVLAQFVPDLLWIPRLVRRRPEVIDLGGAADAS